MWSDLPSEIRSMISTEVYRMYLKEHREKLHLVLNEMIVSNYMRLRRFLIQYYIRVEDDEIDEAYGTPFEEHTIYI
jgi:hypothetical protein